MEPTIRNNKKEAGDGETVENILDYDKHFKHTMSYASKMAAVDIEFNDLTYTVPSSRKGKVNHIYIYINKLKL